jgi:hypothetical protein
MKTFVSSVKKKRRKGEELSKEGRRWGLSEEEIEDDECEKQINNSEVICRTMAVISTRLGFHARRVRHIALDYDS